MNWPFRLAQWVIALHFARQRIPWWGLVRAILSGPVPRQIWRERLRHGCYTCPLFNREHLTCRGVPKQVRHLGCDCFLPFSALTAEPYAGGCWGRAVIGPTFGWGTYVWPSRWAKWRATVRFILGRAT